MSAQKRRRKRQDAKRRRRKTTQAAPDRSHEGGSPGLPEASLDPGGADGQDGAAGRPADSSEHGAQGEDGDPGAQPGVGVGAQATSLPGHQREEIDRPYAYHAALDLPGAIRFIDWIRGQAGQTLGLAFHGTPEAPLLGVANQDEGWETSLDEAFSVGKTIRANLSLFSANDAPQLIVQDSSQFVAPHDREYLRLIIGDVSLLRKTTGRVGPTYPSWPSPADEAYDAFTTHAHWAKDAPAFYSQVAIPRARQKIEARQDHDGTPWRIVYNDLLLRVIAHYTWEPSLVAAFNDCRDPLPHVAEMLELPDAESAYAAILWTSFGWDSVLTDSHYPRLFSRLSDELTGIRERCEKRIATIAMKAIEQKDDYIRNREAHTLYGQRIPWNLSVAEMIERRYLMTAEELLDVVCVAFAGDEPLTVGAVDSDMAERSIRIRGKARGLREEWHQVIEDVAGLGGPLSIPLGAQVIWNE